MIRTHCFRGRVYKVVPCDEDDPNPDVLGLIDPPNEPGKTVIVPIDGETRIHLQTLIHESLHACLPDLSEEAVEECDEAIGRFLWRCGWRKTEESK